MKSLLQWSIRNAPAMNTLMVGILVVGAVSLALMHRELFPDFDLEIILISVPYPGASPEEVEEGICQKIEEAVQPIDGIKRLNSVAREGFGFVVLELEGDIPDVQKVLNEVRSEIDRIPSLPELAEDPEIKQITLRAPAIRVGVIGPDTGKPDAEVELRDVTEKVRRELLNLPSVSQANIIGGRDYQIDIEISESTLRKHGLTLQEVAQIVRRENLELPGGTMKTDAQEVLLRGKNKHLVGREIAKIPLITQPNGVVLTVGDLGTVRDEFVDTTAISRINGRPGLVISVDKTANEDLLKIVDEVKREVKRLTASTGEPGGFQLPEGYELRTWADRSEVVADRLRLLTKNGLQGLILVFLVLTLFLELRLAFWVALGIPISMLGACALLFSFDQTLNMMSMFAFLMALGILVDDAIVIGENIYTHRERGKNFIQAAVDGAYEVLPSVVASVTTTIVAFVPLWLVPGVMGKFIAVMPLAVVTMLVFSLLESTFILPCHLAHSRGRAGGGKEGFVARAFGFYRNLPRPLRWTFGPALLLVAVILGYMLYPLKRLGDLLDWLSVRTGRLLDAVIARLYMPALRWSVHNPALVLSTAAAVLLVSIGWIRTVPFNDFPKIDSNSIQATIVYPDGTPSSVTDAATRRVEWAIREVSQEYSAPDRPLVKVIHRAVGDVSVSESIGPRTSPSGSHVGSVGVELVDTSQRSVKSTKIISEWRDRAGEFPGAESVTFASEAHGPGGAPIEFKLLADPHRMDALKKAVEECKAKLAEYPGVFDIADDSRPGKWEFQLKVKDRARAMGVSQADLAQTVRASYYGEEVMRLQRGRHEVKLMVRYPGDERRSLANFDEIRVRTGDGAERPLTELAQVEVHRGYSTINRLDQQRAITITADVEETEANAQKIVTDLKRHFLPALLARPEYAGLRVRWVGRQEQTTESIAGLGQGLAVALVIMFALLTLKFRSYVQPVLILFIIPFGIIGAIAGHRLMGLEVSLLSLFGLVALTGVVVNDSIVLIDFINRRVRDGVPLYEALLDAGRRRFRAVLCTSLTTIAGLLPLLLETSLQAQFLIPMATSLCFGLMFTTVLVLVLVPVLYLVYARVAMPGARAAEVAAVARGPSTPADRDRQVEVLIR